MRKSKYFSPGLLEQSKVDCHESEMFLKYLLYV